MLTVQSSRGQLYIPMASGRAARSSALLPSSCSGHSLLPCGGCPTLYTVLYTLHCTVHCTLYRPVYTALLCAVLQCYIGQSAVEYIPVYSSRVYSSISQQSISHQSISQQSISYKFASRCKSDFQSDQEQWPQVTYCLHYCTALYFTTVYIT